MSQVAARPPRQPRSGLIRLEWWFDRLDEPRRIAAGLVTIVLFGTASLYLLGLASLVLVSRAEQTTPEQTAKLLETPFALAIPTPTPRAEETARPSPTATSTPAIAENGALIQAPDVPELPLYWSPPIYKPRVVTEDFTQPITAEPPSAHTTPGPQPTRNGTPGGILATLVIPPLRSGTPGPGPNVNGTVTPVRTPVPGATVNGTAAPQQPVRTAPALAPTAIRTAPPTIPAVATPVAPTVAPTPRR